MSSLRAILLLNSDPRAKELAEALKSKDDQYRERLKFIKKQAEDAHQRLQEESQATWEELMNLLVERGVYPDVGTAKSKCLQLDYDAGCLYEHQHEKGKMPSILEIFMGPIGGNDGDK